MNARVPVRQIMCAREMPMKLHAHLLRDEEEFRKRKPLAAFNANAEDTGNAHERQQFLTQIFLFCLDLRRVRSHIAVGIALVRKIGAVAHG